MKKVLTYILIGSVFFSCEDFLEVDISKEDVQLLAPTDGATLNNGNLTFTWNAIEGAERYHPQIAQPSFDGVLQIVRDTLLDNTSFRDSLGINTYQWRVKAENSAYTTEYSTNTLTIEE